MAQSDLVAKVFRQEDEIERLKKQLAKLRQQLEATHNHTARQQRWDSDYVPYADDEYDR